MEYKEIDKETLKKLHEVEMEIMDEIVRICNKNNIEYFLVGGTLLGAVRHKGFIPWDDDMDIGMMRKDYEKFIKCCKEDLNKDYYLQCFETDKKFWQPFAKVRKNKTTFDQLALINVNTHKGIFVDIFPFDNVNKKYSLFQMIQAVLVKNIRNTIFCKQKIREISCYKHKIVIAILSMFSYKFLMKIQNKIMRLNKNDNSEYVVALSGAYLYKNETNKRSVFLPTIDLKFEDRVYKCPNNYDRYLTDIYGDYMTLPPTSERRNHCAVNISFTEGETMHNK